jgi:hypothetical protein
MHSHSASDRSVGYLFLMRARVAKYPPRTTFHTASPRTPVNRPAHTCRHPLADVDEMSAYVAFLPFNDAAYSTGTELVADGLHARPARAGRVRDVVLTVSLAGRIQRGITASPEEWDVVRRDAPGSVEAPEPHRCRRSRRLRSRPCLPLLYTGQGSISSNWSRPCSARARKGVRGWGRDASPGPIGSYSCAVGCRRSSRPMRVRNSARMWSATTLTTSDPSSAGSTWLRKGRVPSGRATMRAISSDT